MRTWANLGMERYYGIESAGRVGLDELGLDRTDRVGYEPSRWLGLPLGLSGWKPTANDVFVDIGSGKGRVLVQAARHYRFKRVIGVELSPELSALARRNIERNRSRLRCPDVTVEVCDAIEWEVPRDLSVAYLFNPCNGDVFARLLDRLVEAVARRGRPLRLIYVNPVEHERVMASGYTRELPGPSRRLARVAGISPGALRRYELLPAAGEPDWRKPRSHEKVEP